MCREKMRAEGGVAAEDLARLMDANAATRRRLYGDPALCPATIGMLELARSVGAAAKFCGSGGAVVVCLPGGESQEVELLGVPRTRAPCSVLCDLCCELHNGMCSARRDPALTICAVVRQCSMLRHVLRAAPCAACCAMRCGYRAAMWLVDGPSSVVVQQRWCLANWSGKAGVARWRLRTRGEAVSLLEAPRCEVHMLSMLCAVSTRLAPPLVRTRAALWVSGA